MKRTFDIFLALLALLLLMPLFIFVAISVRLTSKGPALYWSDRVGHNNAIFRMPKFRTMLIDIPVYAHPSP